MHKILIVDDNHKNIQLLGNILTREDYLIEYALDGQEAYNLVQSEYFDLILMDIMMPKMDGYTACVKIKELKDKSDIPIIFITAKVDAASIEKGFESGGVDYILKPFKSREVLARVKNHLMIKEAKDFLSNQNNILEEKVKERTEELALAQDTTILALVSLIETRDKETGAHILRTQLYVSNLARQLKKNSAYKNILDENTINLLCKSAALHDIGKVGIPDKILLKPTKLTVKEFEEMKKHTVLGKNALKNAEQSIGGNSFLRFAEEIAYSHHEKWDGTGFPEGLKGSDIPLSAQLMALADVYDALVCRRVYKEPYLHDEAVKFILEERGTHFSPDIVDAFMEIKDNFKEIADKYSDKLEV